MSIGLDFSGPRCVCALCGREVAPEGALMLERIRANTVRIERLGAHLHGVVDLGARIVVCSRCCPPQEQPAALTRPQ